MLRITLAKTVPTKIRKGASRCSIEMSIMPAVCQTPWPLQCHLATCICNNPSTSISELCGFIRSLRSKQQTFKETNIVYHFLKESWFTSRQDTRTRIDTRCLSKHPPSTIGRSFTNICNHDTKQQLEKHWPPRPDWGLTNYVPRTMM